MPSEPYRIVNGKKVYGKKVTKSGKKPKLGESYKYSFNQKDKRQRPNG